MGSRFAQSDVSAVLVNFRLDLGDLEGRQVASFSLILVRTSSANGIAFEPISSSSCFFFFKCMLGAPWFEMT